jgi:hypothetical protein
MFFFCLLKEFDSVELLKVDCMHYDGTVRRYWYMKIAPAPGKFYLLPAPGLAGKTQAISPRSLPYLIES